MRNNKKMKRGFRTGLLYSLLIAVVGILLLPIFVSARQPEPVSPPQSSSSNQNPVDAIQQVLSMLGLNVNGNVQINAGSFSTQLICGCLSQGQDACPNWAKGIINTICLDTTKAASPEYKAFVNDLQNPVQNACYFIKGSQLSGTGLTFNPIDTSGLNVSFTNNPSVAYIEAAKTTTNTGDYVYYFSFHFTPQGNYSSDDVDFLLKNSNGVTDISNDGRYGGVRKITPKTDGEFTYSFSFRTGDAITQACMKFATLPDGMSTTEPCVNVADVTPEGS